MPESDARRKVPESGARRKEPESDARRKVPESDARRKVPESDARRKVPESRCSECGFAITVNFKSFAGKDQRNYHSGKNVSFLRCGIVLGDWFNAVGQGVDRKKERNISTALLYACSQQQQYTWRQPASARRCTL